jgi:hypothetical protein
MLPWLGPQVAAAPFAWRAAAYTTLWVAHFMLVEAAVWAMLTVYRRFGWVKKNTRDPQLPFWRMLWSAVVGEYACMIGAGLVHAWCALGWAHIVRPAQPRDAAGAASRWGSLLLSR